MRYSFASFIAGSALVVAGMSGCQCCNRRPAPVPAPAACPVGPPSGAFIPGPPAIGRPIGVPSPAIPPAPVPVGPDVRNYEPPARIEQGSYYWTPSTGGNGVRLEAPIPADPDPDTRVMPKVPSSPEPPKTQEEREPTASLPVGIPQFATARERVASGLKPSIDGLTWLQDAGYRTVLHIRKPGEDDSDRKQITKRGLTYVSMEASPATLSQAVLDSFSKVVAEAKNQPLFVYDNDGIVAGGLWFLYFRTVEKDTDETARIKAARLGLKEDAEGDGKAMWTAVQKLLSGS